MSTHRTIDAEDEFLSAACEAMRQAPGADALEALGWWDCLADLEEPDARAAMYSLFRAQGRELAGSPAFGALLAQPYAGAWGPTPGSVAAAVTRRSARRGPVMLIVGTPPSDHLLVDRPGSGASLVAIKDVALRPVSIPGRLALHEVDLDPGTLRPAISEGEAEPARRRSLFLGRVALALEMLGAAEAALALAVDYVRAREQFGKPIGTFQAVRHLLAWARTDCASIDAAARQAVALDRAAPPGFDQILKALAGRNARRACERTLQAFGGVGFTTAHDHHHFHSRVLALDALLGSSAELTLALGARLRNEGDDPRIARRLLLPDDRG
jgi:hypothetical protein